MKFNNAYNTSIPIIDICKIMLVNKIIIPEYW